MLLFVYGDDALRVRERADEFVTQFKAKYDPASMNVDHFRVGENVSDEQIFQAISAAPFMSEKRFVRIDGAIASLKKAEATKWAKTLSHSPASTVVLFADVVDAASFGKKELAKALAEVPERHEYPVQVLEGSTLRAWVLERAKKLDATISEDALRSLLVRTKEDTWRIANELQKLAAYAHGSPIDIRAVELLVRGDAESNIFGFLDALSSYRPGDALQKLADERSSGAEAFQLFGMLVRQIRLLAQARDVVDREGAGVTKQRVATVLGAHPFVAQKLLTEVKAWPKARVEAAHALARTLDLSMKSGLDPEIAVDRMVGAFLAR